MSLFGVYVDYVQKYIKRMIHISMRQYKEQHWKRKQSINLYFKEHYVQFT